ncbi:hypothetical protein AB1N83_014162 [Pleurotus pulmonarius]
MSTSSNNTHGVDSRADDGFDVGDASHIRRKGALQPVGGRRAAFPSSTASTGAPLWHVCSRSVNSGHDGLKRRPGLNNHSSVSHMG